MATFPDNAYVILVNGPPRAGKDSLGDCLTRAFTDMDGGPTPVGVKFASAIKDAVAAMFGWYGSERRKYEESEHKDRPQKCLVGLTPRQAYISFSEDWAKRTFGPLIFPQILHDKIVKYASVNNEKKFVFIVTDCGFQQEVNGLGLSPERSCLVRVKRKGMTFEGDSRSYVEPAKGQAFYTVENDGTQSDLMLTAKSLARSISRDV